MGFEARCLLSRNTDREREREKIKYLFVEWVICTWLCTWLGCCLELAVEARRHCESLKGGVGFLDRKIISSATRLAKYTYTRVFGSFIYVYCFSSLFLAIYPLRSSSFRPTWLWKNEAGAKWVHKYPWYFYDGNFVFGDYSASFETKNPVVRNVYLTSLNPAAVYFLPLNCHPILLSCCKTIPFPFSQKKMRKVGWIDLDLAFFCCCCSMLAWRTDRQTKRQQLNKLQCWTCWENICLKYKSHPYISLPLVTTAAVWGLWLLLERKNVFRKFWQEESPR